MPAPDGVHSGTLPSLDRPLTPAALAAAGTALVLAGGAYCSAYTWTQGEYESPLVGAAWAAANMLPWLLAWEAGKRLLGGPGAGWRVEGVLAATAALSIAVEAALGVTAPDWGSADPLFQLVRRLPAALLVAGLLALAAWAARREAGRPASAAAAEAPELPFPPQQVDWVKAAGNYLEFRSPAGTALRRMTMAQAEALLGRQGFVRIHRSALVNGARVARVRRGKPGDEVQLADGTWLKVGAAYRPALAPLERRLS